MPHIEYECLCFFSYVLVMERPERHIDLFDYLNKAGPIREPVVRDVFIQVRFYFMMI